MPDTRAFNIEAFKAKFGDGAKASLFYFQPQWPGGIQADVAQQDAIYMVKAAQMPSTILEEAMLNWQGFDWKYPTKHTYADVVITFYVDLKAKIRKLFENWSNLIHDPETNFWATHDEYMVDQRLQMVGYQGEVILEFVLHNAWPKELAQITMDYSTSEVATFDVTFSYTYHTVSFNETGGAA
jgi:hypothetical protein